MARRFLAGLAGALLLLASACDASRPADRTDTAKKPAAASSKAGDQPPANDPG